MFGKDSDCGPGGTATANVAHSPPGACRQEFNAGSNVSTAGRRGRELWHRKYSLHLLHVKHKSVCDLPPEGQINILPAPRQSHAAHYRDTISKIQTDSFTYSLTAFVACLWVSKVAGPSLSPYGSFWSRAQFDFPSASLIKASWTFLWRWERCREKNKGGKEELLPNFRHCFRQVTQTCPPFSPSIFPSLASILSFISSMLEKLINAYTT